MKKNGISLKKCILFLVVGAGLSTTAAAQQFNERNPYNFKVIRNPVALQRAIAIEQQRKNGFGVNQVVTNTITTNTSNAVGTLTEVQAILDGDNSELNLTTTNMPTNSGTQTSNSNQN